MARTDRDAGTPAGERDPDFLTDEELAAPGKLDADVQVVRALAAAGVLPGQQIGGRWLFRWAAVSARIAEPGIDVRDFLTAEQLAEKLDLDVQTVRDLAAAEVLQGIQAGRRWLFRWTDIYTLIAGPGVPAGEVLSARQLARRFGVPVRVVQRAAAPPGTPGRLPGYRIGKQWRFALEAVRGYLGGDAASPEAPSRASLSGSGQQGGTPG